MLEVVNLKKSYGEGAQAVQAIGGLSFQVGQGEITCIVGPSGCGKTTMLKCIAGLHSPDSGQVLLNGKQIDGPPENLAVVFQEYTRSLFPWMTVRRNVTFPLVHKGIDKAQRGRLADEAISSVGLTGFEDHFPWQLSGGMQQRVAIARALAYQPEVLVMDEPFASVDAQTRADLEDLTLRIQSEYKMTIIFVTHDIDEAVYLADQVIVLSARPTRVAEVAKVSLPRPRDQVTSKELPEFTSLRADIYRRIKQESGRGATHVASSV